MSVEPIPVWSLYPNWGDEIIESLQFNTSVGESPSAIEQRRGLRLTPRQYFEIGYALKGPERTYFDLLTMRSGGSPCYLPLWHDVELLPYDHVAGSTVLSINTTYTEFMNCDMVFIGGTHDYELVEIQGRAETLVVLTSPLIFTWPKGTRVVPMKRVKLDQQPSTTRRSDSVHVAQVKFCSIEANRTDAAPPLNSFGYQFVLEEDPNEVDDLSYTYERVMSTLDNTTGLSTQTDVTGRILQQFSWWRKGRAAHHRLRGLFYGLDGRRVPLWVPTIYRDFEPVSAIGAGDLAIDVKRCGYTNLGGPGPQREYILIQARNGIRYYCKIINSVILGDGTQERLFIDGAIGVHLGLSQIVRISFLVLCRLDQDTIEFRHHTATRGMTTTQAVFRSAAARDGIESLYEVPPGIGPAVECVSTVQWWAATPATTGNDETGIRPDKIDKFGNYYEVPSRDHFNVYNANGVLLNTVTRTWLEEALNAWYGGPIYTPSTRNFGLYACPTAHGRYVLAYLVTADTSVFSWRQWWILLEPAADGSVTVKGAVYFLSSVVWAPIAFGFHVHDVNDDDSVLLVEHQVNITYTETVLTVLPTINDYLNGVFTDGSGSTSPQPCKIRWAMLYPIGNTPALSQNLYYLQPIYESAAFGIRLPGIGREILYIYLSRDYIQTSVDVGLFCSPEIINNIAPYYPNGAMLKVPLGDTSSFWGIAELGPLEFAWGRPTDTYTIDNANWRDADGGAAIPFLDEWTRLSGGEDYGRDGYSPQISTQLRDNGHYWVTFIMFGEDDAAVPAGADWTTAYARVRVFDYDPALEVAVQAVESTCKLFDRSDTVEGDAYQQLYNAKNSLIVQILEDGEVGTIVVYGPVFKATLCRFTIPEA